MACGSRSRPQQRGTGGPERGCDVEDGTVSSVLGGQLGAPVEAFQRWQCRVLILEQVRRLIGIRCGRGVSRPVGG